MHICHCVHICVRVFKRAHLCNVQLERGSSAVECRTRNRASPGSNPLCYFFDVWAFSFSPRLPSSLSCINESLATFNGGNVSELSLRIIAA